MQSLVGEYSGAMEERIGMESEFFFAGAIVDSWVESARSADAGALLVLQVAPRGHPKDLVIRRGRSFAGLRPSLVGLRVRISAMGARSCDRSTVV